MDSPEERALRADAPNTDGDYTFARRSALTDNEIEQLRRQGGHPKDIDAGTDMIDTWDIPEGAILDKLDIWRLPVGFLLRAMGTGHWHHDHLERVEHVENGAAQGHSAEY